MTNIIDRINGFYAGWITVDEPMQTIYCNNLSACSEVSRNLVPEDGITKLIVNQLEISVELIRIDSEDPEYPSHVISTDYIRWYIESTPFDSFSGNGIRNTFASLQAETLMNIRTVVLNYQTNSPDAVTPPLADFIGLRDILNCSALSKSTFSLSTPMSSPDTSTINLGLRLQEVIDNRGIEEAWM